MSNITSKNTMRRRASRFVTLAAVVVGLAGIAPSQASAATTNSAGTVSAAGACNRYLHRITLGGTVTLSNRFANGAYVVTRYAYWQVNIAGQATSATVTTAWQGGNAPAPMVYVNGVTIGPVPVNLPTMVVNASGLLKMAVQVGIWNGSFYEYSNWDTDNDGYDTYGQYGIYSYNSVCVASVT